MNQNRTALPFLRYLAKRAIASVFVVIGAITVIFLVGELSGQSPALARLGVYASQEARETFAEEYGLNDPLVLRYLRYLGDVAQGNLGVSTATGRDIGPQILEALPVTASLAFLATIIAIIFALILGVGSALTRGGWFDRFVLLLTSAGQAVPPFWLGILVIQWLAVNNNLIPSGGYVPLKEGVLPWLKSIIAPAVVLAIPFMADLTRILRTAMVDELGKDYVRTAKGIGLNQLEIIRKNVLRNALAAPFTVLGLKLGGLFGGAVLVEAVFRLPGIGSMMVRAVGQADFGVVQAAGIVAAIAFVTANLFVDVAQTWINPRLAKAPR